MATETRVYSDLVAVKFKLAVPPYDNVDPVQDEEGNQVWITPAGETRHMKLVPRAKPRHRTDLLINDFADRTEVKVGLEVTQRFTERGNFPVLVYLFSTHPVTDREEWIRLKYAMLNVRRVATQKG